MAHMTPTVAYAPLSWECWDRPGELGLAERRHQGLWRTGPGGATPQACNMNYIISQSIRVYIYRYTYTYICIDIYIYTYMHTYIYTCIFHLSLLICCRHVCIYVLVG